MHYHYVACVTIAKASSSDTSLQEETSGKKPKPTLTARVPQAKASCPKNMLVPKEQNELGQNITLQKSATSIMSKKNEEMTRLYSNRGRGITSTLAATGIGISDAPLKQSWLKVELFQNLKHRIFFVLVGIVK